MDPLSDVLSLLRPRSYMFHGLDIAGRWSITFASDDGIRCYALLSGECWLTLEDADEAVRLTAGDCVLLTKRRAFRLSSDMGAAPIDALDLFGNAPEGAIVTVNGGGELTGLGGYFKFAGKHAGVLLALLPAVVHIRRESDRAALRWAIETILQELRAPRPGGSLVAHDLIHIILVLALRLHIAEGSPAGVGWLFALADKQMSTAITAMHADPAHPWTLQSLADLASMSRSSFALKFKETVGEPPMEYLLRWRMMLAGDKLLGSGDSISVIAEAVGYESDSAFSAAFRRVMGCSPRQYAGSRAADPASVGASDDDLPSSDLANLGNLAKG